MFLYIYKTKSLVFYILTIISSFHMPVVSFALIPAISDIAPIEVSGLLCNYKTNFIKATELNCCNYKLCSSKTSIINYRCQEN